MKIYKKGQQIPEAYITVATKKAYSASQEIIFFRGKFKNIKRPEQLPGNKFRFFFIKGPSFISITQLSDLDRIRCTGTADPDPGSTSASKRIRIHGVKIVLANFFKYKVYILHGKIRFCDCFQ